MVCLNGNRLDTVWQHLSYYDLVAPPGDPVCRSGTHILLPRFQLKQIRQSVTAIESMTAYCAYELADINWCNSARTTQDRPRFECEIKHIQHVPTQLYIQPARVPIPKGSLLLIRRAYDYCIYHHQPVVGH